MSEKNSKGDKTPRVLRPKRSTMELPTGVRASVFKRIDGRYAWHMVAQNGQIIATDGGQGYENRADAEEMASRFHYDGPDGPPPAPEAEAEDAR